MTTSSLFLLSPSEFSFDGSHVSKNDQTLLKVKKGGYQKSYKKLFGECAVMKQEEKPKWNDLGQHIWMYDQVCGPGLAKN